MTKSRSLGDSPFYYGCSDAEAGAHSITWNALKRFGIASTSICKAGTPMKTDDRMDSPGPNPTSGELVESTIKAIGVWKAEEPGVLSQTMGVVLGPLIWVVRKIVPQSAIEGAIGGMDWAAKKLTTNRVEGDLENLANCDAHADSTVNFHIGLAIVEGGAAGFFGAISLPADIPALIVLALRLIRQVGVEYGYDCAGEEDRAFVLSILAASGANSQAEKIEALALASFIMNRIATTTWKSMAARAATQTVGVDAAIIATKNLAKALGYNLTKRKALAAIPAVGAVIGSSANGWYLREVGVAAQRSFQERWLRDRGLFEADGENPVSKVVA